MENFKFIGITDCSEGASCPHCGSEGRYIYHWEENGKKRSAMAGCYKALTARLEKGDETRYFEILSEKQAKGKELNGWDKNIIRLQSYLAENKYSKDWVDTKIKEVLSQRKQYLAKKRKF